MQFETALDLQAKLHRARVKNYMPTCTAEWLAGFGFGHRRVRKNEAHKLVDMAFAAIDREAAR